MPTPATAAWRKANRSSVNIGFGTVTFDQFGGAVEVFHHRSPDRTLKLIFAV
jgi:hypothetical protein